MVWQVAPGQHPGVAHSQPSRSGAVLWQSEYPVLQVYEHVVPLQLVLEAPVVLQTSPHPVQLVVVLSDVHTPLHMVFGLRQVHAPFEQSGFGCEQVVWLVQVPVLLQVCVVLPLQLTWPGAHTPVQEPL